MGTHLHSQLRVPLAHPLCHTTRLGMENLSLCQCDRSRHSQELSCAGIYVV